MLKDVKWVGFHPLYSMIPEAGKLHLLYGYQQVENIAGHEREREEERERVRDNVWLRKGFGISQKFYCWTNFKDLRDN
jgi:hypothetical protein